MIPDDEYALLNPLFYLALPAAVVVSLACAPVTLSVEGVKRLLPDQVIQVAH
ncbi:MAG TPA: hypothetical protein VK335_33310 [Bryobacteraceae bacterium]|nr:hypothetical protein [Bryobacteraceae bacterium]